MSVNRKILLLPLLLIVLLFSGCGHQPRSAYPDGRHIVRSGETLFSIGERYNLRPADLARWNRLGDGSLIYPGQVIRLTPPTGATASGNARPAQRSLPQIPDQPSPGFEWPTDGRINVEFGGKSPSRR